MNINKLLETIKDTSRDYVGMNGCLYQDITREELNLIVNEIKRLNKELEEKEAILGGIQQLEAEIERLDKHKNEFQARIDKVIECLEEGIDFPYYDEDTKKYLKGMKGILKGSDKK